MWYKNVQGIVFETEIKTPENKADFNYDFDEIELEIEENTVKLNLKLDNQKLSFDLDLVPSQFGNKTDDKIVGLEINSDKNQFNILKFEIEKNANKFNLMKPNYYMEGDTVLSVGIFDRVSGEKYYTQIQVNELEIDQLLATVEELYNSTDVSEEKLLTIKFHIFHLLQ